jgi:hypothetical protein
VNAIIDLATHRLRQTVDLDFFLTCRKAATEDIDMLSRIMHSDLTDETGASANLARIIRNAWIEAAQASANWNVAPDSDKDAFRFLLHSSRNLMRRQLEDFHSELEMDQHCTEVLKKSLSELPIPLRHFCTDPATWLRKWEHRNHLRPVDAAALAPKLQIELGVSSHTARSIADAWHLVIEAVRNGRTWHTTAQLHQEIEKSLAGTINEVMNSDDAKAVIPKSDRALIGAWSASKLMNPHNSPAPSTESPSPESDHHDSRGHKRAASDDPENSPASKKRRSDNSVDDSSD